MTLDSKDRILPIDTDGDEAMRTPSELSPGSTPDKPEQINPFTAKMVEWEALELLNRPAMLTSVLEAVESWGLEPIFHLSKHAQNKLIEWTANALYDHANETSRTYSEPSYGILFYDHLCKCPPNSNECPVQRLLQKSPELWKTAILSRWFHLSTTKVLELFFYEEIKQPERLEAVRNAIVSAYPGFGSYLQLRKQQEDMRVSQHAAAAAMSPLHLSGPAEAPDFTLSPMNVSSDVPLSYVVRPKPLSRRLPFEDNIHSTEPVDASRAKRSRTA